MTPKIWGPPVWTFLHAFTVNISEEGYARVGGEFFSFLTRVCRMLPCPDCAEHATRFISSVKPQTLKTKYDMANMLCHFHNSVNRRKKLPFFPNHRLSAYERVNTISAFNNFVHAFTLPSQRLMNESLHRKMLAGQMTKFMTRVLVYFVKPIPQPPFLLPQPEPTPVTEAESEHEPTGVTEAEPEHEPTGVTEAEPEHEPTCVTEADLEYEEIYDEGGEGETVQTENPNITIEIVVDDFITENLE